MLKSIGSSLKNGIGSLINEKWEQKSDSRRNLFKKIFCRKIEIPRALFLSRQNININKYVFRSKSKWTWKLSMTWTVKVVYHIYENSVQERKHKTNWKYTENASACEKWKLLFAFYEIYIEEKKKAESERESGEKPEKRCFNYVCYR